ncbi:MAG: hypothetical protein K2Q20_05840, partial [Phycisphaerales bacterium]|nr:hypothetical protein [Phycisphaerales bacterium]
GTSGTGTSGTSGSGTSGSGTSGSGTSGPRSSTGSSYGTDSGVASSSQLDRTRPSAVGAMNDSTLDQGRYQANDLNGDRSNTTAVQGGTTAGTNSQWSTNAQNQTADASRGVNQQSWQNNQPAGQNNQQSWQNHPGQGQMNSGQMNQGQYGQNQYGTTGITYPLNQSYAATWSGPTRSADDRGSFTGQGHDNRGATTYGDPNAGNWNQNRGYDNRGMSDSNSRDKRDWRSNDADRRDYRNDGNQYRNDRRNNDQNWRNQPSRQYNSIDNDNPGSGMPSLYNGQSDRTHTSASGPASWRETTASADRRDNRQTANYLHFNAKGELVYLNDSSEIAGLPDTRLDRGIDASDRAYGSSNSRVDWDRTGNSRRIDDRREMKGGKDMDNCDTSDERTMDDRRSETTYGSVDRAPMYQTAPARPMGSGRTLNALDPYTAQPVNPSLMSSHNGKVIG